MSYYSTGAELVTPAEFGASPDRGDNQGQLQDWIDNLVATGLPGYWPPVTYKCLGPLVASGNLAFTAAPGAILDIGPATNLVFVALTVNGLVGPRVLVTVPVAFGAPSVSVAPGDEAGFATGDLVKLTSDDKFDPARGNVCEGELIYVLGTSSGTVTFATNTRAAYTTVPRIRKVTPAKAEIGGSLTITGDYSPDSSKRGVLLKYCADSRVDGLTCLGVSSLNMSLNNCINSVVSNLTCRHALNGVTTGYAMGFSNATRSCYLETAFMHRVRHATTTGGTVSNVNDEGGVVRDCVARHVTAERTTGDSFDQHGNTDNFTWDQCISIRSDEKGFNSEAGSTSVLNCKALWPTFAACGLSAGAANVRANFYVENFQALNGGAEAIRIGTAPDPGGKGEPAGCGSVEIVGMYAKDCVGIGLRIGRPGSFVHNPQAVKVRGGLIDGCGTTIGALLENNDVVDVQGLSFRNIPAAQVAINSTGNRSGAFRDMNFSFVAAATGAAISFTNTTNVSYGGLKAVAPTPSSLVGVSISAGNSGLRSLGDNDFSQCNLPYSPTTIDITAGALTVPLIAPEITYRFGDGITPKTLSTINGGRLGDVIRFCGINGTGPITVSHGTGNISLSDAINFYSAGSTRTLTLAWNNILGGWQQVSQATTLTTVGTLSGSRSVTLEDRGKTLRYETASAMNFTLEATFQVGFEVTLVQYTSTGQISFLAASGAYIRNSASQTKTGGRYAEVTVKVVKNTGGSAAEWLLTGTTGA